MAATRIFTVPWHLGDWCAHTAMLTPLEYAFYHRALMECYMRGGRLSDTDMAMVKRWACSDRTITERSSDDYQAIIERYFEKDAEGYWHNRRADEVLAEIAEKSQKARKATEARDKKHRALTECTSDDHQTMIERSSDDHQAITESASDDDLTINHKPKANNTSKDVYKGADKPRRPSSCIACPEDVDPVDWDAWMAIRRDKNLKSSTEGFLRAARREASKCNISLQQAIEFCIPRGWAGFTEAYYKKAIAEGATPPERRSTPEEDHEYDMTVALASGYPAKYAEAGIEKRYSGIEADVTALDAVRATLNEEPA